MDSVEFFQQLKSGVPFNQLVRKLTSPGRQALDRRLAAVRQFDNQLCEIVIQPDLKESTTAEVADNAVTIKFDDVVTSKDVERLPRKKDTYRFRDSSRREVLSEWIAEEPKVTPDPDMPGMSKSFRDFNERAFDHYDGKSELDALYHLIAVDQIRAADRFETGYEQADAAFNMARCGDLLDLLDERSELLSGKLQDLKRKYRAYRNSRILWSSEYYDTIVYLERDDLRQTFAAFVESDTEKSPWIFDLHAPGGSGKTMFVRWVLSRYLTPARIPCVRIDFDVKDPRQAAQHPWLLLLEFAFQLNRQLPGHPFNELLKQYESLRQQLNRFGTQVHTTEKQGFDSSTLQSTIPRRFLSMLAESLAGRSLVVIFDTTEELLLYQPEQFETLVATVFEFRARAKVRLVISGRYALSERLSKSQLGDFHKRFGTPVNEIVEPFCSEEAIKYLLEIRQLPSDDRIDVVVDKSNGNPFKLAIYADLIRDAPDITADEIKDYKDADLAYLIERIVDRIPDEKARWVLRYGAIPRLLTKDFLADVMASPLQRAMSNSSPDQPKNDGVRVKTQDSAWSTDLISAGTSLDIDGLWSTLEIYTSQFSWVSRSQSDPNTLVFHAEEVRPPMRRLLREKQPQTFAELQELSASYFEDKARNDSAKWADWILEAWFHRTEQTSDLDGKWIGTHASDQLNEYIEQAELTANNDGIVGLCPRARKLVPEDAEDEISEAVRLRCQFEVNIMPHAMALRLQDSEDSAFVTAKNVLNVLKELQTKAKRNIAPEFRLHLASARLLAATNEFQEALSHLDLANDELAGPQKLRERRFVQLRKTRGEVLSAAGHSKEAIETWETLLRAGGVFDKQTRAAIRRMIGREYERTFQFSRTVETYREAVKEADGDLLLTAEFRRLLVDSYRKCGRFRDATIITAKHQYREDGRFETDVEHARWLQTQCRLWMDMREAFNAAEVADESIKFTKKLMRHRSKTEFDQRLTTLTMGLAFVQRARVLAELMDFDEVFQEFAEAQNYYATVQLHRESMDSVLESAMVCLDHVGDLNETKSTLQSITDPTHSQMVSCDLMMRRRDLLAAGRQTAKFALLCISNRICMDFGERASNRIAAPSKVADQLDGLVQFLEGMEPAAARLEYLRPLRYWPKRSRVPAKLRDRLVELALPDREVRFSGYNLTDDDLPLAVPIIDVLIFGKLPQLAADVLDVALARQFEAENQFAIRELLLAADRLNVFPDIVDDKIGTLFECRQPFRAFNGVVLYEHGKRCFRADRIGESLSCVSDAMGIFSGEKFQSKWTGLAQMLWAQLNEDTPEAARQSVLAATQILGRLGWKSEPLLQENQGSTFTVDIFERLQELLSTAFGKPQIRYGRIEFERRTNEVTFFNSKNCEPVRLTTDDVTQSRKSQQLAADAANLMSDKPEEIRIAIDQSSDKPGWHLQEDFRPFRISERDIRRQDVKLLSLLADKSPQERVIELTELFGDGFSRPGAGMFSLVGNQFHDPGVLADWDCVDLRLELHDPFLMAMPWEFASNGELKNARLLTDVTPIRGVYRAHLSPPNLAPPAARQVLVLHPSYERLLSGDRGTTRSPEKLYHAYQSAGFDDVVILEDPSIKSCADALSNRPNSIVHIVSTFNHMPSLGVFLAFDVEMNTKQSDESFTPRALSRLLQAVASSHGTPLIILDAMRPYSLYESVTQLLYRNMFATELFENSPIAGILATGLWDEYQQDVLSFDMPRRLGEGESLVNVANSIRQFGGNTDFESIIGSVGTALFADYPKFHIE